MNIIDVIKNKQSFVSLTGADDNLINKAEKDMGLKFAEEYKVYVRTFGAVSYKGHELTGVCNSSAINVVSVTNQEKNVSDVSVSWYVIEQANTDGIVYWQTENGEIFKTVPGMKAKKICASLSEYIKERED